MGSIGGPTWSRMSPGLWRDAQSVPWSQHLVVCLRANWCHSRRYSAPTLVPPRSWLCHRLTFFQRLHYHPCSSRTILQGLQTHPPQRSTCSPGNSRGPLQQHLQTLWIPEDIVSDRGPQLMSRVRRKLFRLLGVSVSLYSGYHPQMSGQTERKIQEVGRYIRAYCHNHQNNWSQ